MYPQDLLGMNEMLLCFYKMVRLIFKTVYWGKFLWVDGVKLCRHNSVLHFYRSVTLKNNFLMFVYDAVFAFFYAK